MTSSVFVHDIQAPAPLEEFFLPLRDEVRGTAGVLLWTPDELGLGTLPASGLEVGYRALLEPETLPSETSIPGQGPSSVHEGGANTVWCILARRHMQHSRQPTQAGHAKQEISA